MSGPRRKVGLHLGKAHNQMRGVTKIMLIAFASIEGICEMITLMRDNASTREFEILRLIRGAIERKYPRI